MGLLPVHLLVDFQTEKSSVPAWWREGGSGTSHFVTDALDRCKECDSLSKPPLSAWKEKARATFHEYDTSSKCHLLSPSSPIIVHSVV